MKRIIFLLLLVPILSYAQESYTVYNVTGGAELVRGNSRVPLTRRQTLLSSDTIRLGNSSRLDIVVTNTSRQIVSCQDPGTSTVYTMVRTARNKANDISQFTTKNISQSVSNQPTTTSVVYGTTMRGQSSEILAYHAHLAEAIYNVILDVYTNRYKSSKKWTVEMLPLQSTDSLFSFALLNRGKKNLYFNVVAFSFEDGNRVEFDFLFRPSFMQELAYSWCVSSGERLELLTYIFEDVPNVYYLAFGTDEPFDEDALSFQLHKLLQTPISSKKHIKTPGKIDSHVLAPR